MKKLITLLLSSIIVLTAIGQEINHKSSFKHFYTSESGEFIAKFKILEFEKANFSSIKTAIEDLKEVNSLTITNTTFAITANKDFNSDIIINALQKENIRIDPTTILVYDKTLLNKFMPSWQAKEGPVENTKYSFKHFYLWK